eukprot:s48_g10.t1
MCSTFLGELCVLPRGFLCLVGLDDESWPKDAMNKTKQPGRGFKLAHALWVLMKLSDLSDIPWENRHASFGPSFDGLRSVQVEDSRFLLGATWKIQGSDAGALRRRMGRGKHQGRVSLAESQTQAPEIQELRVETDATIHNFGLVLAFHGGISCVDGRWTMDDGVQQLLANTTVQLRPSWLTSVGAGDASTLLQQLLAADLRDACEGSLPVALERQHNVQLEGQHLVQILEMVDIANPSAQDPGEEEVDDGQQTTAERRPRRQKMLKICLTDGAQAVCGIERRPIAALRLAVPGTKLLLGNRPLLRRGLLLLEPQHMEAFGTAVPQAPGDAGAPGATNAAVDPAQNAAPAAPPRREREGREVLLRFYVFNAMVATASTLPALRLSLGDGLGSCEALLEGPLLRQLLGQDGGISVKNTFLEFYEVQEGPLPKMRKSQSCGSIKLGSGSDAKAGEECQASDEGRDPPIMGEDEVGEALRFKGVVSGW